MKKRELPPLCAAVKTIRRTLGLTQEKFAQSVQLAVMTISRFERGRQVPTEHYVLERLSHAAADAGLEEEETLFTNAITKRYPPEGRPPFLDPVLFPPDQKPNYGVAEWRLMQAARAVYRIRPDATREVEEALNRICGVVDLVDEVLRKADPARVASGSMWAELEKQVSTLADRRALEGLKEMK
jgi:transcriptional regulator with XRE-family HTH domain